MDVDEALSSFTSSIWNHGNPDPKHKVKDLKKKVKAKAKGKESGLLRRNKGVRTTKDTRRNRKGLMEAVACSAPTGRLRR